MKVAVHLLFAAGAVVLLLALRIVVGSFRAQRTDYVRTRSTTLSRHPERTGIADLGEISFTDPSGTRLAGWYAPSYNRAAVVLVHGTHSDRTGVLFETECLATAGFGVLALDLPGQGASEGRTRWGVPERRAISAAVDWLTARSDIDSDRIGGFGSSMGAYVVTQAAVLDSRLRSVTLAASPNDVIEQNWRATRDWGWLTQIPNHLALRVYGQSLDLIPREVIGKIAPRSVLLIGGELDTLVPRYMADELYAAAHEPKELWIVPGARHVDYAKTAPQEYRRHVVDFFTRTLLR